MNVINNLNWRYAAKKMNGEAVPQAALDSILEATRLTASSYGLQPFSVVVVSNKEVKEKLRAAAYNQGQVTESDVVLVFAVNETLTEEMVNNYINLITTTRNMDAAPLEGYKQMMLGKVKSTTAQEQKDWNAKQAYIALGTAMIAAAELKVDACPMEGFDANQFDEILGLKSKGLTSVVILPLGFRAEDDFLANLPKVRKSTADFLHFVK